MQTVLITGGTGLVGKALRQYLLNEGYKIIILTRSPSHQEDIKGVTYAAWDINSQSIDVKALQESDFIIHLAGAGVIDKKWTPEYKAEILNSRTQSSKLLADTLKQNSNKVQAIISSSAIGWYGPDKVSGHLFTEEEPAAADFLGQTCLQWEKSIEEAASDHTRVCKLRTGIVLSKEKGALEEFSKPLRLGVGAIIGTGRQVISWIHLDDLCRMFHHAIKNPLRGSFNAVAPNPVTNKKLTLTLATALRGKFFIPLHIPPFVIRMKLGSRSVEVLKSTTVSADKILSCGFTFLYPTIDSAIDQLTNNK
ncbi:MAG: TIGR01777 family oxidoreductase [Ferruginibacter sp.]